MRREENHTDLNVSVVVGEVARDASCVDLGDGRVFTSFDVVARSEGVRTVVPVTYEGDMHLAAGEFVAVAGFVNKRFFASGGSMATRTDLRAAKVTIIKRKDQLSRFVAGVIKGLNGHSAS